MRWRYNEEHLAFLREHYPLLPVDDLTDRFNKRFGTDKSAVAIKSALTSNKIVCGRQRGKQAGTYRLMTKEQAEWLADCYQQMRIRPLTEAFNRKFGAERTVKQIRTFIKNHQINCGRTGCFDKGNKPWNSGTKGLVKPNSGSFKKGSIPGNEKDLGSERVCSKDGYILIKVAETNPYTGASTRYKAKHKVVWEQHHGPVPQGNVVIFLDGDKTNCEIDNLVMLTKAQNLYLNRHGYAGLPAEVKGTAIALAKLEVKRFERLKEKCNANQDA